MADPIWNQRIFYELLCYSARGRRWLDLGCGRGPTSPELIRVRRRVGEKTYAGVDLDMDSLKDCTERCRVRASVGSLPFPDGSFDLVTSNMVFEHLGDPVTVLKEANRVLDGEGVLIVHTASSIHYTLLVARVLSKLLPHRTYVRLIARYTGRKEEDIFPTVYRANTAKKFSRAVTEAGFKGGLTSYLETPLAFPQRLRGIEKRLRRLLPGGCNGTILAVYVKKQWV